jgi:hypothetical protein
MYRTSPRRKNARRSRRGMCAPRGWFRGPAWKRSLRHLQSVLGSAEEQIRYVRSEIRRAVQHVFANPERSCERFVWAGERLDAIANKLAVASADYQQMMELAILEPHTAAELPEHLAAEALHIVAVGKLLAAVSEELELWLATLGDPEEVRKLIAPPRPIPAWLYSKYPSLPSDLLRILLLRRRRSRCRATEDAPRRISRGRAPPFLSACSL